MSKRVRLEEPAATKKVAAKPVKKEKVSIDKDYLYRLCSEIYHIRIDEDDAIEMRGGRTPTQRMLAEYKKKYGSDERALKRFNDQAQIYAPVIRVALRVMKKWGQLPKEAEGNE